MRVGCEVSYSFSEENLVESLTKGTFLSSKTIIDSKSSSICSNVEYSEIQFTQMELSGSYLQIGKDLVVNLHLLTISKISTKHRKFRYDCKSDVRNDLEIFDYRLFNYGLKPHMLDFVTDEDNHAQGWNFETDRIFVGQTDVST